MPLPRLLLPVVHFLDSHTYKFTWQKQRRQGEEDKNKEEMKLPVYTIAMLISVFVLCIYLQFFSSFCYLCENSYFCEIGV